MDNLKDFHEWWQKLHPNHPRTPKAAAALAWWASREGMMPKLDPFFSWWEGLKIVDELLDIRQIADNYEPINRHVARAIWDEAQKAKHPKP